MERVHSCFHTCAHGHGCPSYHPHGSHAVVARSRYRDRGRVEGCGGDAVRLHHGGVMDHMWLSGKHWLGVVRSLSGQNIGKPSMITKHLSRRNFFKWFCITRTSKTDWNTILWNGQKLKPSLLSTALFKAPNYKTTTWLPYCCFIVCDWISKPSSIQSVF